jgi:hypothetical protein
VATVIAKNILDRAATILQDTTGTRWPQDELLSWLNDAQREVVLLRPDACAVNEAIPVSAGISRQTLPAAALKLIDIMRNVTVTATDAGENTVSSGDAIRRIERRVLDDQVPGWHTETGSAVKHYVYDERDPKSFYVYPALTGEGHIEGIYSSAPADVAVVTADATISLDDIYANAILDYVLYRAYSKDADYAANSQRAVGHYQAFMGSMGATNKADTMTSMQGTTNDGTPGNAVVPKPHRPQ